MSTPDVPVRPLRGLSPGSAERKIALFQASSELLALLEQKKHNRLQEQNNRPPPAVLAVKGLDEGLKDSADSSASRKRKSSGGGADVATVLVALDLGFPYTWELRGLASTNTHMGVAGTTPELLLGEQQSTRAEPVAEGNLLPEEGRVRMLPAIQYELNRVQPKLDVQISQLFDAADRQLAESGELAGLTWEHLQMRLAASPAEILSCLASNWVFCDASVDPPSSSSSQVDSRSNSVSGLPNATTLFRRLPRTVIEDALDTLLTESSIRLWNLNTLSQSIAIEGVKDAMQQFEFRLGSKSRWIPSEVAVAHALRFAAVHSDSDRIFDPGFERFRGIDNDFIFNLCEATLCKFRARRVLQRADSEDAEELRLLGFEPGVDRLTGPATELPLQEFLSRWTSRLPAKIQPKAGQHLCGTGVVHGRFHRKSVATCPTATVQLFDEAELTKRDAASRIREMFVACPEWTLHDATVYLRPLLDAGQDESSQAEALLLLHGRAETVDLAENGDALGIHLDSVTLFTSR